MIVVLQDGLHIGTGIWVLYRSELLFANSYLFTEFLDLRSHVWGMRESSVYLFHFCSDD
jgi:hypothetical protein